MLSNIQSMHKRMSVTGPLRGARVCWQQDRVSSVSFHDPGTSSEISTNSRLSICFTSCGGRSWKFTISGSLSRIVGGFDLRFGELKCMMTDDVSPPMLNVGRPMQPLCCRWEYP